MWGEETVSQGRTSVEHIWKYRALGVPAAIMCKCPTVQGLAHSRAVSQADQTFIKQLLYVRRWNGIYTKVAYLILATLFGWRYPHVAFYRSGSRNTVQINQLVRIRTNISTWYYPVPTFFFLICWWAGVRIYLKPSVDSLALPPSVPIFQLS